MIEDQNQSQFHLQKHPRYSVDVLYIKVKELIKNPDSEVHHDFSTNDCSELFKWGLVDSNGVFNNKLQKTSKINSLIKQIELGKTIEQKNNFGLLYALGLLEKNTKPKKELVKTGIITKLGVKTSIRTIWTA